MAEIRYTLLHLILLKIILFLKCSEDCPTVGPLDRLPGMVGKGIASLPVSTQGSPSQPCSLWPLWTPAGGFCLSLSKGRGYPCFGQDILPGHVQFDIQSEFYPRSMVVEPVLDGASEA